MVNTTRGLRAVLFLFAATALSAFSLYSAQSNLRWNLLRVSPADTQTARMLYSLGFEHLHTAPAGYELVAAQSGLESIRGAGLNVLVLDSDHGKTVAERNQWATVLAGAEDFATGSMGGYFNAGEMLAFVDSLRDTMTDPVIGDTVVIGASLLGRPVWMVEVTGDSGKSSPEVFFNSLLHAREGMSAMSLLYFLRFLTDNYASVDSVRWLVDNRRIFCVPLVNPDGYEINWNIYDNENRFGYWRKNARDNDGDGIHNSSLDGVDLNRNFGYKWGYDSFGSSKAWSNPGFRGDSAFSEPESRAIRDLVASRDFKIAINSHVYGNSLLKPWSYIPAETPDSATFNRLGALLTTGSGYKHGNATDVLGYTANGEFTDWEYGDTLGGQVIAWTAEIGESYLGYWPPANEIEPIALKVLPTFFSAARAAGFWPGLEFTGATAVPDNSRRQTIRFRLLNHGLGQSVRPFTVTPVAALPGVKVISAAAFGNSTALPAIDSVVIEFPPEVYSMAVELAVEQDGLTITSLPLTLSRAATDISADLDHNGRTDIFDLLALLRALSRGVPEGDDPVGYDLNEDGSLDIFDLLDILQRLKKR